MIVTCRILVRSWAARSILKRICRSNPHRVQQIAHLTLVGRDHPFQHRTPSTRPARDQHLLIDRRSGGDHVWLVAEALKHRGPVLNPVALHAQQAHMRS